MGAISQNHPSVPRWNLHCWWLLSVCPFACLSLLTVSHVYLSLPIQQFLCARLLPTCIFLPSISLSWLLLSLILHFNLLHLLLPVSFPHCLLWGMGFSIYCSSRLLSLFLILQSNLSPPAISCCLAPFLFQPLVSIWFCFLIPFTILFQSLFFSACFPPVSISSLHCASPFFLLSGKFRIRCTLRAGQVFFLCVLDSS